MLTRSVYKFFIAIAGVLGLLLLVQTQTVQARSNLINGGDYLPDGGEIFEDDQRSELNAGYQTAPVGDLDVQLGGITQTTAASLPLLSIMPLGDSITKGTGTCSPPDEYLNCIGYREDLWNLLVGDGHSVNFVGSQGTPYQYLYSHDNDHEGHGGWNTNDIKNNIYGSGLNWLENYPADIILLHIGSNDFSGSPPFNPINVATRVMQILDKIDDYESSEGKEVWVILAKITKRIDTTEKKEAVEAFNVALENKANARILAGDNILVVDMESALVYPDDLDPVDKLHPTPTGYSKMAAVWFAALEHVIYSEFGSRVLLPMVVR